MTFRSLGPFLGLTFGLTWGIVVLLLLFGEQIEALLGAFDTTNPLYILAVYAPAFAAFILVLRYYGVRGLLSYLRRLTLWRMSAAWWAFLLLGIPAVVYLGAALSGTLDDPLPFATAPALVAAVVLALLLGPVEEFGWRGLALPLLQRRFAPIGAGVILGVIWGVWHLPAFLFSDTPHGAWALAPFFGGTIAASVILTAVFNATRGSLLIAALFHFQLMNPVFPDAQPWANLTLALAAVLVVAFNRTKMFSRDHAVTDVLMPPDEPDARRTVEAPRVS